MPDCHRHPAGGRATSDRHRHPPGYWASTNHPTPGIRKRPPAARAYDRQNIRAFGELAENQRVREPENARRHSSLPRREASVYGNPEHPGILPSYHPGISPSRHPGILGIREHPKGLGGWGLGGWGLGGWGLGGWGLGVWGFGGLGVRGLGVWDIPPSGASGGFGRPGILASGRSGWACSCPGRSPRRHPSIRGGPEGYRAHDLCSNLPNLQYSMRFRYRTVTVSKTSARQGIRPVR